jgi:H+/gluconate symporter-like permease
VISSWRRTCTALAILVGLLSPAACQRDDSFLLVEVAGNVTLAPAQMRVTVIVGYRSSTFFVPPEPTVISLPTSFTVELDRSITGPVVVIVEALDGVGTGLAYGETTQAHINTGGETIIAVTLGAPL